MQGRTTSALILVYASGECFVLTVPVWPFLPQNKLAPLTAETDKACGEGGSPEPGNEAGAGTPLLGTRVAEDGSGPPKIRPRDPERPAIACRDRKTGRCGPRTRTCGNRQLVRPPLMAPCSNPAASHPVASHVTLPSSIYRTTCRAQGMAGTSPTSTRPPWLTACSSQTSCPSWVHTCPPPSAPQHHRPSNRTHSTTAHRVASGAASRAFRRWARSDRESSQQRQACSTSGLRPHGRLHRTANGYAIVM